MNGSTFSENYLHRELHLARRPRSLTDDSKSTPAHNIRGQSKLHQIEYVEELGAKFQRTQYTVRRMAERRVLDQGEIEIMEGRSSERVASERSEAALVGAGTAGQVDRNGKE